MTDLYQQEGRGFLRDFGFATLPRMTQRYDDILAFIEVVKAGSFTAAGARLALAKSVISDRVRNLENALGVELLRRTTRSVTPTERGIELFETLNPLVQGVTEAVDAAASADGPLTGRLRMSAPISFGMRYLTPVIAGFARAHPQLEIALDFDDRAVDIIGAGYDLALRIGRLTDSALMARKLCDSDRVVCCSPAYAKPSIRRPATCRASCAPWSTIWRPVSPARRPGRRQSRRKPSAARPSPSRRCASGPSLSRLRERVGVRVLIVRPSRTVSPELGS